MKKEEIISAVSRADNTVLSFPERGPWGDSRYRGNCSGYIPAYFAWKYNAKTVAEIFAGSGTTSDVCKDMGIPYMGIDLNPNPVRSNIISMDILDDSVDLPDFFYSADMLFLHPPYPSINGIHYSNSMWKDTKGVAAADIQEMDWEKGMKAVSHAVMRGYMAIPPGSYEVVLMGEIRSKGQYRSMLNSLVFPTELHQTFVKLQHNCVSDRSGTYSKSDRALTGHEMIAVFKKPSGYEICCIVPTQYRYDVRKVGITWKDIVAAAIRKLGEANLDAIYTEVEKARGEKLTSNQKAKVRQTLQFGNYINVKRGRWAAA